jgi:multiple sugar transport system substrate-binding protein
VRADYETKLKIQLSAGGGPDLFTMADTVLPTVAAANLLEPLDNVLTPTTFDELVDAAVTIKQKLGITGFAVRSRLAEETPWWVDFNNWIQGYGGSWSDGKKLTIDSPQNVAALTAFKKMYDSGAFSVGDDASTFRTKFSEGQVAMMIDATGAPPAMISAKVPSTSMISSPLPFPKPYTSQVGIYFGINAHTKNKALAEDFLNWFLTKDTQQALSENLGNTSTLATKTTVSDEFLAKNPWAVGYREDGENTRSSVIRGFESVTPQIAHTVLSQVEKVLLQDVSPQRALSDAASSLK